MSRLLSRRSLLTAGVATTGSALLPAATRYPRAAVAPALDFGADDVAARCSACCSRASRWCANTPLAEISPDFPPNGTEMPSRHCLFRVDDLAIRALAAQGRWPGGQSAVALARRDQGDAGAHPGHPAQLRRGLDRDRPVDRRAARACAAAGRAGAGGALHRLPLPRRDGAHAGPQRVLLRKHRPVRRLSPADHPGLRA